MADNASIIWTGDATFDLNIAADTSHSCLITTLYTTWFGNGGPIEASGSLNNASFNYSFGVFVNPVASEWGGVLSCTGRDASAYIEDVYLLFDNDAVVRSRGYDIASAYNSSQDISSINSYIKRQSWTYVLGRSQTEQLSTPTGLYADQITSNSARTNWNAVENASNYKVQYKAAGETVWTETYTD